MGMLSWTIGQTRITQLIETDAGQIIQEILPDVTKTDIKALEWLSPHFADADGNLQAVVQAFLVEDGTDRILIDPCVGNGKTRNDMAVWGNLQTGFLSNLEELCGSIGSITKVFCTHLHFDHIGWNTRWDGSAWVPTFPAAEYLLTREEFEYWRAAPQSEIADDRAGFQDSIAPVYEAGLIRLVRQDETISGNVHLLPTPGHTPGHVSVAIGGGVDQAVITGDVIHHPSQVTHPEWRNIADSIPEKAYATRAEFIATYAGRDTLVMGSHFSQPTAGRIVIVDGEHRFDVSEVAATDSGIA